MEMINLLQLMHTWICHNDGRLLFATSVGGNTYFIIHIVEAKNQHSFVFNLHEMQSSHGVLGKSAKVSDHSNVCIMSEL